MRHSKFLFLTFIACSALASCARPVEEDQTEAAITSLSPSPSARRGICVDCLGFQCAFFPVGGLECVSDRIGLSCTTTGECVSGDNGLVNAGDGL
jgi:hypothetical protein